jgi:hypothetical protein
MPRKHVHMKEFSNVSTLARHHNASATLVATTVIQDSAGRDG